VPLNPWDSRFTTARPLAARLISLSGLERGLPIVLSCKIDNEIRSGIYPITPNSHDPSVVPKYKKRSKDEKYVVVVDFGRLR
jgi:hypothetical protein